jgi:hypothetical protein
MDMKVIELLEDIMVLMCFSRITSKDKAICREKIRKLLDELA